jgi:GT2 family glycosyltransferase
MTHVSVYIPFKDSDESLTEVLAGVVAQEYPIAEVVLVDDGSQSPSMVTLPDTVPTRVVRHPKNLGVAAARNTALREVQSEFVVAFDADIVPDKGCVAALVAALIQEPSLSGIGGRVTERHTELVGDRFRAHFMKQDRGLEVLRDVDLFGGCTLYRRSALVDVGGYTEMLQNSFEDFDIARRVRERGGTTMYLPTARGEHIKRDTVTSAVDTLYRWSYPHWESDERLAQHNWLLERIQYPRYYYERAVSSRPENLDYKIKGDMALAAERLRGCSDPRLLYPLILYPMRAVLRDLLNYRECQGSLEHEIRELFGDLLATLLERVISPELARRLHDDCADVLLQLYGTEHWEQTRAAIRGDPPDLQLLLTRGCTAALPAVTFVEFYSPMLSEYASRTTRTRV